MNDFFPILDLKGDPHDIGLAHGRALAGAISKNLDLYYSIVREFTGLKPDQCLNHAGSYLQTMGRDVPDLLEEMEGIATGAGVSLEEIMFLNARSEIMSIKPDPKAWVGECTALGLTKERTATGEPILAQNWDWYKGVHKTCAVFRIKPTDGARALYLAEAGQLGKIGVNEYGVGVLLNILFADEKVRHGLPVHVLLRLILNSRETAEAVNLVKGARRAGGSHLLVGDARGHIAGLELTPTEVGVIKPKNGVLLHTNHYCIPKLAQRDIGRNLLTDTIPRFDRAAALISTNRAWGIDNFTKIFTNHEDGPSSICRHLNLSAPEFLHIITIAGCIIDLSQRKMLISFGQPCRAPYFEIALK